MSVHTLPGCTRPIGTSRAGFGAAEVLVAIAIIGIGLVPVLSLFPGGTRQTQVSESHVRALALAEQALESWYAGAIARGFSSGTADAKRAVAGDTEAPAGESEELARMDLDLQADPVEGKRGLWHVTARVEWVTLSREGERTAELTIDRFFSEPGIALRSGAPFAPEDPIHEGGDAA